MPATTQSSLYFFAIHVQNKLCSVHRGMCGCAPLVETHGASCEHPANQLGNTSISLGWLPKHSGYGEYYPHPMQLHLAMPAGVEALDLPAHSVPL